MVAFDTKLAQSKDQFLSLKKLCNLLLMGQARRLSRQESLAEANHYSNLRVITPIDINAHDVCCRADIVHEIVGRLKEESPDAYRPIENVVAPMEGKGMVNKVAKVRPVITIKG